MFKKEVVNCNTFTFIGDHSGCCAFVKVCAEAGFDENRSIAQLNKHTRTVVIPVVCMVACAVVVFARTEIFEEVDNIFSYVCITLTIGCNGRYNFGDFVHEIS